MHESDGQPEIANEGQGTIIPPVEARQKFRFLSPQKVLLLLLGLSALLNILVLVVFGLEAIRIEWVVGLLFSLAVLGVIILLGIWWDPPPPPPTVNVANIAASVGTACNPAGAERIAREALNPPNSAWVITSRWTQTALGAGATRYVPSMRYVRFAFAELQRTWFYTCQRQQCQNGVWANVGASYSCNVTQSRTIQLFGGPNGAAPLQGWSDAAIDQSFNSGYYQ